MPDTGKSQSDDKTHQSGTTGKAPASDTKVDDREHVPSKADREKQVLADEKSSAQVRVDERDHSLEHLTRDDVRRDDVLGGSVTQLPNNLVQKVEDDAELRGLVVALRRLPVGSFQFMGDTRTAEAALKAGLELRRTLNSEGIDVRVMSDSERKKWAEDQPGAGVQTNENA